MLNRQKWLQWRSEGVGASDAPTIMGKTPTTPFQLWERRNLGLEVATNEAMQWGIDHEEEAIAWAEKELGMSFVRGSDERNWIVNPNKSWMRATIDGMNHEKNVMIEMKCPFYISKYIEVKETRKVPEIYIPQVQHQLECKKTDRMLFSSYNPRGKEGVIVEVKRDDGMINQILEKEEKWWNCYINMIPPELTDRDYLEMDSEWSELASDMHELKKKIRALEISYENCRGALILCSRSKNAKDAKFKFTKTMEKGRVDYDAIPELKGVDLDLYRKNPIEKWRLSSID